MCRASGDVGVETIIKSGVRGATADVAALASLDTARRQLAVLVRHYHDDDVPGATADVALTLAGLPAEAATARVAHYRVDATHSNAYTLWQSFGSPVAPTKAQYTQLEAAAQLATFTGATPATLTTADGAATLTFPLPAKPCHCSCSVGNAPLASGSADCSAARHPHALPRSPARALRARVPQRLPRRHSTATPAPARPPSFATAQRVLILGDSIDLRRQLRAILSRP